MYGTLISTQTLATTAASVTFSSIPQTYTDLVLVMSARGSGAQVEIGFNLQFNGDTAANYSMRDLNGSGSAAASGTNTGGSIVSNTGGGVPAASATANTFGNVIVTIPNYAGSASKVVSWDAVGENNAAAAYQDILAGRWTGTAAITSVAINIPAGSFVAGSMFSLYGLTHF